MAEFRLDRIRFTWKGVWTSGTDYSADDIVEYEGSTFVAKRVHTAATFANDLAGSDVTPAQPKWERQSDGVVWKGNWAVDTEYAIGNIVKYGSGIYKCIEIHRSSPTFSSDADGLIADINKWTLVAVSDTDWKYNWTTNTLYRRNDLVRYNGRIYKAVEQHISAATTTQGLEANQLDWEVIADGDSWLGDWTIGTRYRVNDIIRYGGIVYRCIIGHTSADNVSLGLEEDQSKWETVINGIDYKGDWLQEVRYKLNDIVKRGGNLLICVVAHTSDNLFATDESAGNWQVWLPGNEYEGIWNENTRYQIGDFVTYGGYTYKSLTYNIGVIPSTNEDDWQLALEGYRFRDDWNRSGDDSTVTDYRTGDVVRFSGSLYVALEDTTNEQPDLFANKWEQLVDGRQFRNTWEDDTEYYTGDIVTWQGISYIALKYHRSTESDSRPDLDVNNQDDTYWKYMIKGTLTNKLAKLGDLKTFEDQDSTAVDTERLAIGTTGQVLRTTGTLPGWDTIDEQKNVYYVGLEGKDDPQNGRTKNAPFRTIRYCCDYLLEDEPNRVGIGATIMVSSGEFLERLPIKLPAYVALVGDELRGTTVKAGGPEEFYTPPSTPDNPNPPQSLFPSDNQTRDMFYVRNSCGIRRLTLKGLNGELGAENEYGSKRVTAGAYVSLDPGQGPEDTSVWISNQQLDTYTPSGATYNPLDGELVLTFASAHSMRAGELVTIADQSLTFTCNSDGHVTQIAYPRSTDPASNYKLAIESVTDTTITVNVGTSSETSAHLFVNSTDDSVTYEKISRGRSPYIQGVTTIGTGCIGMKIDGALHNGGNKSIVANDFTQVLSDGIGYWATNEGRSELVSVFTYYAYIGYLAENGGQLRATNGNNSYGTFGSLAEGFSPTETPQSANIDNETKQADVHKVYTDLNKLLVVGYENAGKNYTGVTDYNWTTAGTSGDIRWEEFRKGAISKIDRELPEDSTTVGGAGYKFLTNFAQGGGEFTLTLSASETRTADQLIGMRVYLVSGPGAGQYGWIQDYNVSTKVAQIYKEGSNQPGWDNVIQGTLSVALNETTVYEIEPRVTIAEPTWTIEDITNVTGLREIGFAEGPGLFYTAQQGTDNFYVSADGESWTLAEVGIGAGWHALAKQGPLLMAAADDNTNLVYSNDGVVWDTSPLPGGGTFQRLVVGGPLADTVLLIQSGANAVYRGTVETQGDSTVAPSSWATSTLPDISLNDDWIGLAYGAGKWIVLSSDGYTAISTDNGQNWTQGGALGLTSPEVYTDLVFGNNTWVASTGQSDRIIYSADGENWSDAELVGDSTRQNWKVAYSQGAFVTVSSNGSTLTSNDGVYWESRADTSDLIAIAGGTINNVPTWCGVSLTADMNKIQGGRRALARVEIAGGSIARFVLLDPGSGYITAPNVLITDPEEYGEPYFTIEIEDGVLAQPTFYNRGTGYISVGDVTLEGDGIANIYQFGNEINVKNLTLEPGPGANVSFANQPSVFFRVSSVKNVTGSAPNLNATLVLAPGLDIETRVPHNTALSIREKYSQVRLTGHDFLDIGTGNFEDTNYPELYVFGRESVNETRQANEVAEAGGGRVFYTSTDQDGNFRVGELFRVSQAQGGVTLNAEFFDLEGLDELRLGGIQVGGTQATITEFTVDNTFVANSDAVIPTQRAIKTYLENRLSGGGANAFTNTLTAGTVVVTNAEIGSTEGPVNFAATANFKARDRDGNGNIVGGVDGAMAAMNYFLAGRIERDEFNG